ncbi:MAG: ABC transporter ATP-binding protein [Deltaproteobacteria bacterium]|nr:ABC transporter ATP-binding protein [Deltaproteobacteria bacterium]
MLEIQDIHTYYDTSYILQGVSLKLEEREVVGLFGRNGAGKTTTVKSIMGIPSPQRGSIKYKGEEISRLASFQIARKGIGYVPQGRMIFTEFTVKENLEIVARNLKRKGVWNLKSILELFPLLERLQKRMGNQLSGGEQQLLAVARTLMGNPELMILDEPTEGLAPLIVASLMEAIQTLKSSGITVLLAEQNIFSAIKVSDRVYVLDEGKIVFSGSSREFTENQQIAREHLLV